MNIKIFLIGVNRCYKKIKIFSNDSCLYDFNTLDNSFDLLLDRDKLYRLSIYGNFGYYEIYFYVDYKYSNYIFNIYSNYRRGITFKLVDYYYDNLSIEKGVISFWQKI